VGMMKSDFRNLEIWKMARSLRKDLRSLCDKLPTVEHYRLSDQLIRAARSVTANIAEGYGRYHYQENIQFCRVSRGSLYEILDHLTVCTDEGYISDEIFREFEFKIENIVKKLNGYIKYLKHQRSLENDKT
jgi:four helix bundle protein